MAYSIEEEQELNELKAWWKDNYKSIIVIFILVFGGVFGWKYWQNHQVEKMQNTSAQYDQLLYSQQSSVQKDANLEQFVQQHDKTTYAVFALLDQAHSAVSQGDFAKAEQWLTQALQQANDDILLSVTALRLASVQFQQQKYDLALASLDKITNSNWNDEKLLLKGDVLIKKGDESAAKALFEQALTAADPFLQQQLEIRLNNLK